MGCILGLGLCIAEEQEWLTAVCVDNTTYFEGSVWVSKDATQVNE
jgi:hypothetical protein